MNKQRSRSSRQCQSEHARSSTCHQTSNPSPSFAGDQDVDDHRDCVRAVLGSIAHIPDARPLLPGDEQPEDQVVLLHVRGCVLCHPLAGHGTFVRQSVRVLLHVRQLPSKYILCSTGCLMVVQSISIFAALPLGVCP